MKTTFMRSSTIPLETTPREVTAHWVNCIVCDARVVADISGAEADQLAFLLKSLVGWGTPGAQRMITVRVMS